MHDAASNTSSQQRLRCTQCLRPQSTCICKWVTPIASSVELLLLQHPLEVGNAKGTAQLLHLCLPNSHLIVGERFDDAALQTWLFQPFADINDNKNAVEIYPILLYPQSAHQSDNLETVQNKEINQLTNGAGKEEIKEVANESNAERRYRLIVLDGTWRKSRKMLALNPLLQQLPRLALHNPPISHYTIRKAHRPEQLSSFEASCLALMQLEKNSEKFRPLLTAFDGFITQQQSYISAAQSPKEK